MVGVMGGKGEPGLLDPLPSTRLGMCRGSGDSWVLFLVWRLAPRRDGALSGGRQFLWREPSSVSICCIWKVLGGGRNRSARAGAVGAPR